MRVHHIAFRTEDPEALSHFYENVLGLARIREQPGYSIWFDLGASVLMLEKRSEGEPSIRPDSMDMIAFQVSEVQRQVLGEKLVQYGAEIEDAGQYTTYFRDPDGRRIGISHYDFAHRSTGDLDRS